MMKLGYCVFQMLLVTKLEEKCEIELRGWCYPKLFYVFCKELGENSVIIYEPTLTLSCELPYARL